MIKNLNKIDQKIVEPRVEFQPEPTSDWIVKNPSNVGFEDECSDDCQIDHWSEDKRKDWIFNQDEFWADEADNVSHDYEDWLFSMAFERFRQDQDWEFEESSYKEVFGSVERGIELWKKYSPEFRELISQGITPNQAIALLSQPDKEVLADWWCIFNHWKWPEAIPDPHCWDASLGGWDIPFYTCPGVKIMEWIDKQCGRPMLQERWNKVWLRTDGLDFV